MLKDLLEHSLYSFDCLLTSNWYSGLRCCCYTQRNHQNLNNTKSKVYGHVV